MLKCDPADADKVSETLCKLSPKEEILTRNKAPWDYGQAVLRREGFMNEVEFSMTLTLEEENLSLLKNNRVMVFADQLVLVLPRPSK